MAKKGKFDDLVKARGRDRAEDADRTAERPNASTVGKRSDAGYRQVSAYVRRDTHRKVKMALLKRTGSSVSW